MSPYELPRFRRFADLSCLLVALSLWGPEFVFAAD